MNKPLEKLSQLKQVELSAQIAGAHLKIAEFSLQSGGSTDLALCNLMVAGIIFADCLNNLRAATQTRDVLRHTHRPDRLSDRPRDPFETIFPGTFCYTKALIIFLSCSEIFCDYSMN